MHSDESDIDLVRTVFGFGRRRWYLFWGWGVTEDLGDLLFFFGIWIVGLGWERDLEHPHTPPTNIHIRLLTA